MMKTKKVKLVFLVSISLLMVACKNIEDNQNSVENHQSDSSTVIEEMEIQESQRGKDIMITIQIQINGNNFTGKLYENETTKAFLEILPLNITMEELNGNEKFYYMSENFPTNASHRGEIKTGDLMLYGSNCFVLFYEDFYSSYSYTKLGYIEDVDNLYELVGRGNAEIRIVQG